MDRQQSTVERFLKLGYSYEDILRVLESLNDDAQTNDILQELLKTSRSGDSSPSGSRTSSPQLVARGCSPPQTPRTSWTSAEEKSLDKGLRPIVIDGSNVAMSHGNKQVFSCRGVQLAVNWFWDRGHRDITVFVPLWRKEQPRPDTLITDQHILYELEQRKILVFTPSRCVNGKRVVCYDDRYIVKLAFDSDGVIVSNDNYRDLQLEKPQWKKFIEERLLMYTFANDKFMPPDDPLGRNGPTIDDFLKKNPESHESKRIHCPYGKKCTYGIKCKYYHPERTNQSQLSVADELRAKNKPALEREVTSDTRSCSPCQATTTDMSSFKAFFSDQGQDDYFYGRLWPNGSLSQDDVSSRLSPTKQRSPSQSRKSLSCPSIQSDDAFGSLDKLLGQLYLRDLAKREGLSCPYSRGMAGSRQAHTHTSPVLTHRTDCHCKQTHCVDTGLVETGYHTGARHSQATYSHLAHKHSVFDKHVHPHPLHHISQGESTGTHYPYPHTIWGGSSLDPPLPVSDSTSERRKSTRTQLSTIFPQSTVDHAMRLYPHAVETSELVPLIQRLRTNHVRF